MRLWERIYWGSPVFELRGLVRRRYWALRPPQTVLWGGRPLIDRQFGSPRDRAYARAQVAQARRELAMRRLSRGMVQVSVAFEDALTPVLERTARAFRELGRAMQESGLVLPDA